MVKDKRAGRVLAFVEKAIEREMKEESFQQFMEKSVLAVDSVEMRGTKYD